MSSKNKELHNEILKWDYFCAADYPQKILPKFRNKQESPEPNSFGTLTKCSPLPDAFYSISEYMRAFLPLMRVECWAGISKSRFYLNEEEYFAIIPEKLKNEKIPQIAIQRVQEVTVSISAEDFKEYELSTSDVLLITFEDRIKSQDSGKQFEKQKYKYDYALAIISNITTYQRQETSILFLKVILPFTDFEIFPQEIEPWNAIKLTTLLPVEREYSALHAFSTLKLRDQILKGIPSAVSEEWERGQESREFIRMIQKEHGLNRSQAEAVSGTQKVKGISLIQGPPGTGKTKTIVSMMGALLSYPDDDPNPPLIMGDKPPERYYQISTLDNEKEDTIKKIITCSYVEIWMIDFLHSNLEEILKDLAREIVIITNKTNTNPRIRRILICTPSNKAVDEILFRVGSGMLGLCPGMEKKADKNIYPQVVRIGQSSAMKNNVKDYSLESVVKKQMGWCEKTIIKKFQAKIKERVRGNSTSINSLKKDKEKKEKELESNELSSSKQCEIREHIDELTVRINNYSAENRKLIYITEILARLCSESKSLETIKTKEVLQNSNIVCSTLSGSGQRNIASLNVSFPIVIIDEAAQAVEATSLIPLQYECEKCIMVGDPKQLPPTVLSRAASKNGYDRSLYVRMFEKKNTLVSAATLNEDQDSDEEGWNLDITNAGGRELRRRAVFQLTVQYRMHPQVASFPNQEFYKGMIEDGDDMGKSRRERWHDWRFVDPNGGPEPKGFLGPLHFFNLAEGKHETSPKRPSLCNMAEITFVLELYRNWRKWMGWQDVWGRVGIVTPYREQLFQFTKRFKEEFGEEVLNEVEITTVDGFQGQEKDIIIFSCVRAMDAGCEKKNRRKSFGGGVGFLGDPRRMNVAMTRARCSLWVVGHEQTLRTDAMWGRFCTHVQKQGVSVKVGEDFFGNLRRADQDGMDVVEEQLRFLDLE